MATRKRKSSVSPLGWFQRLKQRLTSRTAIFIWGALFGNAVLVQTIGPWDVLTKNPVSLLSTPWQDAINSAKTGISNWGESLRDDLARVLKQRIGSWALEDKQPTVAAPPATSPSDSAADSSAFAACRDQFPDGRALQLASISAQWAARALCSDGFAVLYSGRTKTPLVVAERLNRHRLQKASGLERTDKFYADARVPSSQRATLSDYQGSGYDRGHLAAAANQYTPSGMAQSFALTNMVPQDPTHNRKLWAKLESDIRKYVQRASGDVFVFTGATFADGQPRIGSGQVWVPSHLFKLIYDASTQRAWAYILPNRPDAQLHKPIDYAEFVVQTQWHLLAGLPVVGGIH